MTAINMVVILEQWLKIIEPLLSIKTVFTVQWRFTCPVVIHISRRRDLWLEERFSFSSLDNRKLTEQIVLIFLKVHLAFNCEWGLNKELLSGT